MRKSKNHRSKKNSSTGSLLDLLNIHPRFMRSVHLERDIADPASSMGYKLTPLATDTIARIGSAFSPKSTQRAWRIAGDYGSGKTDFALALARLASGARSELPQEMRQLLPKGIKYKVAVATGDSEALGRTVLRAIGTKTKVQDRPSTADVVEAVTRSTSRACSTGHDGLLLIIDELGKNLEYAARHVEMEDVFLLQRLAEEACRSGSQPLVIVALLHQGISAYSSGLDAAARREWDKIAGRYEEVVFIQSLEQMPSLVASTLSLDTSRLPNATVKQATADMAAAVRYGLYGVGAPKSLAAVAPRLFPLHPTTLPVLVRVMRRFGQNERAIFSFIASAEPFGLQHHCTRHSTSSKEGFYRVSDLFDFACSSLSPKLNSNESTNYIRWGIVNEVIASARLENEAELAVVKTVGMLSVLDATDIPATEEVVSLAIGDNGGETAKAISKLRKRGIIYERGSVKGLCLWPHTSVNLDEAFRKGQEMATLVAAKTHRKPTEAFDAGTFHLCRHIQSEPLVPRAYYASNGTLRHADVRLLPSSQVDAAIAFSPASMNPDLVLTVLIPSDSRSAQQARKTISERHGELLDRHAVILWEPLPNAVSVLADLMAWEWVESNTPQLAGDRFAREEVGRQIAMAKRTFNSRLGGLENLAVPLSAKRLLLFTNNCARECRAGRELLELLGEECDRIFSKSPRVLNELVNRRQPSSAAVAARTKLAEAMATSPHKENLGMDDEKRPPEMALYLSVVRAGGFHTKDRDGNWSFRLPSAKKDALNLLPTFAEITRLLRNSGDDALVSVPSIFDALSQPPFGAREGLLPVILALYLATNHQRVALYEDGTYLHSIGGQCFLRLMKEPQAFQLQYCTLEGIRGEVFSRLLKQLEFEPRDPSSPDLLDLVRPLSIFIARGVPDYARKTNNLPVRAISVRKILLNSREPARMVFTDLPEACGLQAIRRKNVTDANELAGRIKQSLHDLQMAYPNLLKRAGDAIRAAFDMRVDLATGRPLIAARASQLAAVVTEPTLKSFAIRLADPALSLTGWIESLGNLLARKSAERWTDQDEVEFMHQLEMAAGRFKRTECALVGTTTKLNGHACRIALTKSDGAEVAQLVDWNGLNEQDLSSAREEVNRLFDRLGPHAIAATMAALWSRIDSAGLKSGPQPLSKDRVNE